MRRRTVTTYQQHLAPHHPDTRHRNPASGLPNRYACRIKPFYDPFKDIFELDIMTNQYPASFGKFGFEIEQLGGGLAAVFDITKQTIGIENTQCVSICQHKKLDLPSK